MSFIIYAFQQIVLKATVMKRDLRSPITMNFQSKNKGDNKQDW